MMDLNGMTISPLTTSDWMNVTPATNSSMPVEDAYWKLSLLVFPIATVFGNILVVLSVIKEKSLQNATNYFIVSLAVADISLALLVMPLATWVEVQSGEWDYSDWFCDTFIMLDVMFCTASIVNLAAISVDRFIAVTRPIKYSKHTNINRVYLTIILIWLLSFGLALPLVCGLNNTSHRVKGTCKQFNSDYIIYSSLTSFYIPAIIMLCLYYKIFKVIRQRAERAKLSVKGQTFRNAHANRSQATDQHNKSEATRTTVLYSKHKKDKNKSNEKGVTIKNKSIVEESQVVINAAPSTSKHSDSVSEDYFSDDLVNGESALAALIDPPVATAAVMTLLVSRGNLKDKSKSTVSKQKDETDNTTISADIPEKETLLSVQNSDNDESNKIDVRTPESTKSVQIKGRFKKEARYGSLRCKKQGKPIRKTLSVMEKSRSDEDTDNEKSNKKRSFKKISGLSQLRGMTMMRIKFPDLDLQRRRLRQKEKSAAKKEKKATKTLAIVLGVFLVCWVPFFTLNLLDAICIKIAMSNADPWVCHLDPILMGIAVWLGYINSFLNPIIYTIFNNEFRRAFKKLLNIK